MWYKISDDALINLDKVHLIWRGEGTLLLFYCDEGQTDPYQETCESVKERDEHFAFLEEYLVTR